MLKSNYIIYSHRGNLDGSPIRENHPDYIDAAIEKFFCEVDIRFSHERFFLGHDTPDYFIEKEWIEERKALLLFHCKNLSAAIELSKLNVHFFCHSSDAYVLTSQGKFWVHDISYPTNNNCIIPLIDKKDIENFNFNRNIYGICTDYPNLLM